MTNLLWFILGISLIFGIARYNESNKLFWTLLFAYTIGFAGTKMVLDIHHGDEQSNESLTQVYSTQESVIAVAATLPFTTAIDMTSTKVTASNPVSQGFTPVTTETKVTPSEVFGRTRDQPLLNITKPPELCLRKDFLTLHDTG